MKKIAVIAALVATSFAAPVLPTQAAHHMMDDANAHCLVFPMLKKECREMAHDAAMSHHAAMNAHVEAKWDRAGMNRPKHPVEWWNCAPAAEGAGHLLDC